MMKRKIAVFAYAFSHRKTHDFLLELAGLGYKEVVVLAAPWRKILVGNQNPFIRKTISSVPPIETQLLCRGLGYDYYELEHDDINSIKDLVKSKCCNIAIISGARILKEAVIECFADGVINFHPGVLPQTSGLDAFYYTIENNLELGVTAHYIDSRVDAGELIFFEKTHVGLSDSPEVVQYNNYQTQIFSLRKAMHLVELGNSKKVKIDRPNKNLPMELDKKNEALNKFEEWKLARYVADIPERLLNACRLGYVDEVENLIKFNPGSLECKSEEGWTPLIVAAYNQRIDVVIKLLGYGANPNSTGKNGTSVLMYAKTALLNSKTCNYQILENLIAAGADINACDKNGKTIKDYVRDAGDFKMLDWLAGLEKKIN